MDGACKLVECAHYCIESKHYNRAAFICWTDFPWFDYETKAVSNEIEVLVAIMPEETPAWKARAMLDALVDVLEEKGIMTSEEWEQKIKAKIETAAKTTQSFREIES